MRYNLPAEMMHAPALGPTPSSGRRPDAMRMNHRTGHVEDSNLSSYAFDEQYNSFHRCAEAVALRRGAFWGSHGCRARSVPRRLCFWFPIPR